MKTLERRALKNLEVREADKDSGFIGTLVGHAAVFNSDSVEFDGFGKPWVERVAPGAFKRTLTESPDVRALWSHRSDAIIGRAPKTLTLREDDEGLAVEISLIDTQQNRDLLTQVRSGQVDSMSFGFTTRSQKWDKGDQRDIRTLLDVDLFEVSAVVWPAYPGSSISARSAVCLRGAEWRDELKAVSEERAAAFAEIDKAFQISNTEDNREARLRILCK